MPKSTDSSQPEPVSDKALRELADLAKVPAEERELFFSNVREAVQTACERDGIIKEWSMRKKGAVLEKTAFILYKSLRNLNKHEREFIERLLDRRKSAFDRISGDGGLTQAAYQFADLFSILIGKPPPVYPHQAARVPQRGRGPGAVKNWIFQDFVFDLIMYASGACGKLTLQKNIRRGTLIEAIKLLAPHLPDGFAPQRPSATTLQRIKNLVRATEKAAEELDRVLSDAQRRRR